MLLQKTKENRYRHYKGGIYYKIAEGTLYDWDTVISNWVKEAEGKYEETDDNVTIYVNANNGAIYAVLKDRICEEHEFMAKIVVYQSEETGLFWVRLKDKFEGFTDVNGDKIKRFILANA